MALYMCGLCQIPTVSDDVSLGRRPSEAVDDVQPSQTTTQPIEDENESDAVANVAETPEDVARAVVESVVERAVAQAAAPRIVAEAVAVVVPSEIDASPPASGAGAADGRGTPSLDISLKDSRYGHVYRKDAYLVLRWVLS